MGRRTKVLLYFQYQNKRKNSNKKAEVIRMNYLHDDALLRKPIIDRLQSGIKK